MCRPTDAPPYDEPPQRRLSLLLAEGIIDDEAATLAVLLAADDPATYMRITTSDERIALGLRAAPLTRAAGYTDSYGHRATNRRMMAILAEPPVLTSTEWAAEVLVQAGISDEHAEALRSVDCPPDHDHTPVPATPWTTDDVKDIR